MPEGYCPDSKDDQLDELMCEYVDGTMDPAVRAAFEEFLAANPEIADQARCLCQTRDMLCSYGCRHSEESLETQIRRRVVSELGRQDRSHKAMTERLARIAMVTSAVGVVLLLGMMTGLAALDEPRVVGQQVVAEDAVDSSADSMVLPTDAHIGLTNSVPLEWNGRIARPTFVAPIAVLPVISRSSQYTPRDWPAWLPAGQSSRAGLIRTSSTP